MKRRDFLKRSILLALGTTGICSLPFISEAAKFDRKRYKVTRTTLAIGTVVSITAIDESRAKADDAIGSAFDRIRDLENIFTRFQSQSPVYSLNKEGKIKDLPPELLVVLTKAVEFFKVTNGAFDITVKPLLDLYESTFKAGKQPSEKDIENVLGLIGTQLIHIKDREVIFKREGMGITLDGIAKGFIIDEAFRIMLHRGLSNFLINAGGDIRVKGVRKDGRPWKIAIQNPKKEAPYPDIISLSSGSIATSGDYEVYYDKEKIFHHIVNPSTGLSPIELDSVSVVSQNALTSDALSTALFVLGPKGIDSLKNVPHECLMITRKGEVLRSTGWRRLHA